MTLLSVLVNLMNPC